MEGDCWVVQPHLYTGLIPGMYTTSYAPMIMPPSLLVSFTQPQPLPMPPPTHPIFEGGEQLAGSVTKLRVTKADTNMVDKVGEAC